jgi:glucokinase
VAAIGILSDRSGLRVGLDVGATKTLGVVLDHHGTVVAQERLATTPGPDGVVGTATAVVESLRRATGDPLLGPLGLGVPGLVDPRRGAVRHAVNLGLDGEWFPVGDLLGSRLGVSVRVENDVNVAAIGAAADEEETDLGLLSIGTGLAAGLVLGGRLRRGVRGAAGEVGHIPVDPAGARCRCGQRGCLETVATGAALAAAYPDAPSPAAAVFAAADVGEPRAVDVRDRFVAGVAEAVRLLALAVDPDVVVLGGGVASALGDRLRTAVATALADQATSSAFLASLDLAARLRTVGPAPVAAIGAAVLGSQPVEVAS